MDGWIEVDMTCMDGILSSASIGTIILVVAIKIAFLFLRGYACINTSAIKCIHNCKIFTLFMYIHTRAVTNFVLFRSYCLYFAP